MNQFLSLYHGGNKQPEFKYLYHRNVSHKEQKESKPMTTNIKQFKSFKEFYPFYLTEHSNKTSRRLHYIGSSSVLVMLGYAISTQQLALLTLLPLMGYGPAWIGHFFFQKNKPATFKYPLYSFMGDWMMLKDGLLGRIK